MTPVTRFALIVATREYFFFTHLQNVKSYVTKISREFAVASTTLCQQNVHQQFKGCYRFELGQMDLDHREYQSEALGSIQGCLQACQRGYFM